MLKIQWTGKTTNAEEAMRRANTKIELINTIKIRRLELFGHMLQLDNIDQTGVEKDQE